MTGPGTQELGKLGKRKAKIGNLRDGSWNLPDLSYFWRKKGHLANGTVAGEELAAGEGSQDPVVVFCPGVMMIILSKLDVRSIAVARVVSGGWLAVASADILWAPKCQQLWLGKAHIPRISKVRGISKMQATSLSIMDGKRTRITRNDMCDHIWDFHFTELYKEQPAEFYKRIFSRNNGTS